MIALPLAELAGILDGVLQLPVGGREDSRVDGPVVVDSRLATPGSIFFAMPGEETDGHRFAAAAVAAGAVVVVAERPLTVAAPVILVPSSLAALAELARVVVARVRSAGTLRVVAVTGSNGKTTTKNMLRAILERVGTVVAPRGSFNNQVGAPLSMLEVGWETDFLVVEMGASAAGEIAHLVSIVMPDVAIVLKVGLAHAGGFGSIEETQKAKAELVTGLPQGAVAVLNADDSRVAAMAGQTRAQLVWFGLSDAAQLRAEDIDVSVRGTEFTLVTGTTRRPVRLRILGEHHVLNALAAIAATAQLGVDLSVAVDALEGLARAERWRMELVEAPGGYTVINDAYNASPDSMAAALKTLAEVTRGTRRSVAVLGEMAELGSLADEEHDRIGRLVVRLNVEKLVVVGRAARHIHNAAGLEGSWDGESVLVASADEAYDLLRGELRSGDVVLVKSSNSAGLRLLGDRLGGVG
ncbi:MAG TPA: UDP-N-acetylmuramoyl-tripeptide--D-alanyl-D-alanine ligase [Terrimesophilobacter sp.]|uniref:UDP-N-acetylmuramoyl-tripeptide--D-alanyl-D- alanine ligase n=1 Tax=Terrimesophilobacter sp. TaxID=2906435 RepID=UPI002F935B4D